MSKNLLFDNTRHDNFSRGYNLWKCFYVSSIEAENGKFLKPLMFNAPTQKMENIDIKSKRATSDITKVIYFKDHKG